MATKRKKRTYTSRYKAISNNKSHRLPWRRMFLYLAIMLLIGGGILLFFSSLFNISYIEVQGNVRLTHDDILSTLDLDDRQHIFLLDTQQLQQELMASQPLITSAVISKKYFPNKVMIVIDERTPAVSWHTGNGVYLVDDRGIVIDYDFENTLTSIYAFGAYPLELEPEQTTDEESEESIEVTEESEEADPLNEPEQQIDATDDYSNLLIILEPGDRVADEDLITYVLDIIPLATETMGQDIKYILQGESRDFSILFANDILVRFSIDFTIDSELQRLRDTLAESEEQNEIIYKYVDLRFEKVYFD